MMRSSAPPLITGGWHYLVLASVCPSGLVLLGHPSVLGAQMVLVCFVNKEFCLSRELDTITQRIKTCLSLQPLLEENESIDVQHSRGVKISLTHFLWPRGR